MLHTQINKQTHILYTDIGKGQKNNHIPTIRLYLYFVFNSNIYSG